MLRRLNAGSELLGDFHASDAALTRIMALSDGVFAITMTLLVLDLHVPDLPLDGLEGAFLPAMAEQWPQFLSFVISFLVQATFWMRHHHNFHYIKRFDRRLVWLNVYFLLAVSFNPYPTAILSRYGDFSGPVVMYALSMAVTGTLQFWMWRYATSNQRLVAEDLDERVVRLVTFQSLIVPVTFVVSIPIALFWPLGAMLSWAVLGIAFSRVVRH